jgi:predicted unusual protein kinase regulating ubiquinone biosynthesis (AarF/ABC1/UbiB family)
MINTNISYKIKKLINVVTIFSVSCYNIAKYKLRFATFEDAVISLCNSLTKNNYIFTKVIQWGVQEVYHDDNIDNANSNNIKDNVKLKNYFSVFSNNVPYTQDELEHSLACIKNVKQYASSRNDELVVDYAPINSGSVALVFKARLNSSSVAIKILRPNIRNKIKEDIDVLLSFFDNIVIKNIIWFYIKINIKKFIVSSVENLLNQCNFNDEVKHILLFKNNLKNKKNIVIPHVYTHYTEMFNEIIIMEFLDGPVAKNVPLDKLKNCVEHLQSFFFDSLFRYNVLHADFHLGNIIIMNDGDKIGIIDFGIVYFLTDELSNSLFDIMFLSLKSDQKNFYSILKIVIRFICFDERQYKIIFETLNQDKEIEYILRFCDFSANRIVKIINKIVSLENIEVKHTVYKLFLSSMSGLQTIEYANDNKPLTILTRVYMDKSIQLNNLVN